MARAPRAGQLRAEGTRRDTMTTLTPALSRGLLDVLIRAGLIVALVVFCYRIFHPFLNLMLWSMILGVTLYPLHKMVRRKLGGKNALTATLVVLLAIAVVLVPVYLLASSLATSAEHAATAVRSGTVEIPPPSDAVDDWPVIGHQAHDIWEQASTDLGEVTEDYQPQLKAFGLAVLAKIAAAGVGLLLFMVALILAGVFMAYGENGHRAAIASFERIFGNHRGEHIADLCTKTIRAVAQGVIGIAFIQALLVGVAFIVMGIPGAGLLTLAVLLLGIAQLPAAVLTIPVIIGVLASRGIDGGTIVFAIYTFIAGLADNVLKPLMLGRGVDVPMPVILIGALGGMVTGGVIGLFIGPVVLAIGYELYWQWVEDLPPGTDVAQPAVDAKAAS
jgi:predicted PurR-regulated permease PerM